MRARLLHSRAPTRNIAIPIRDPVGVCRMGHAGVAELADALDSKSSGLQNPCGFDPRLLYQTCAPAAHVAFRACCGWLRLQSLRRPLPQRWRSGRIHETRHRGVCKQPRCQASRHGTASCDKVHGRLCLLYERPGSRTFVIRVYPISASALGERSSNNS